MAIRAKTVILSVLALLVVALLAVITMMGWQVVLGPKARAVTDRKFDATPARLARGKYLVEGVAACFHCHSEHNLADPQMAEVEGKRGAGWHMPVPELGDVYSRNITSDKETGLGNWTDDEIARALQEGISKDGSALFPIMPYMNFAKLDDEDVASIVTYLRTVPAVKNAVPRSKFVFPLNFLVNVMPTPLPSHPPAAPRTTAVARGEYLVRNVAGCQDCHSSFDDKGQPMPGLEFGGGGPFQIPNQKAMFAANITQDASGIPYYDEALFIETLHGGVTRGRTLSHIMPFEAFKNMTDDDIRDIFAYLKSVPPVKHRISNTDPPTKCPVCNQTHGLGDTNAAPVK